MLKFEPYCVVCMTEPTNNPSILRTIFGGKQPASAEGLCVLERLHLFENDEGLHQCRKTILKFPQDAYDLGELIHEMIFAVRGDVENLIDELERDEDQLHYHYQDKIDSDELYLKSIYSQDGLASMNTIYLLNMPDGNVRTLFAMQGTNPSYRDVARVLGCVRHELLASQTPSTQVATLFKPRPPGKS